MSSQEENNTHITDATSQQPSKLTTNTSTNKQSLEDSDYTSSSGSSSGDEEHESDDETQPSSNAQIPKHKIKPNNDLKSRLATFLPQMERSNRDLEADSEMRSKRIDDVGEEEDHYIEMNLGLGVLTEKQSTDDGITIRSKTNDDDNGDALVEGMPNNSVKTAESKSDSPCKRKIEEI